MKKEFSKRFAQIALVATMVAGASAAFATDASTDGSSLGSDRLNSAEATMATAETVFENPQAGRALLKAEDLKKILAIEDSSPSPFSLEFSSQEMAKLRRRIATIESQRTDLGAKLIKDLATKKNEIRAKRREIQTSRLGARERDDSRLAKALYENILQETNLDSQLKRALEDFDRANLVSIDFMQIRGQRLVQSISIGPRQVWAIQTKFNVAQK